MENQNNKRRRGVASPNQIMTAMRAGAYDKLPLREEGVQNMPMNRPNYDTYRPDKPIGSMVNTDLPDNVYGPQLPDLEASARAYGNRFARQFNADEVTRDITAQQAMYDMNNAYAPRLLGDPSPQDYADVMNDPRLRDQVYQGGSPDVRTILINRLRARMGGAQPPTSGNVTGR
jgi:hypothetical protein